MPTVTIALAALALLTLAVLALHFDAQRRHAVQLSDHTRSLESLAEVVATAVAKAQVDAAEAQSRAVGDTLSLLVGELFPAPPAPQPVEHFDQEGQPVSNEAVDAYMEAVDGRDWTEDWVPRAEGGGGMNWGNEEQL